MTTTQVYAVNKEGNVELIDGVKNSWAGAMHVWNTLNKKYNLNDSFFTGFKRVWGNFGKGLYTSEEDIVLGSTFDSVMVKKENLDQLISAFEYYYEKYPDTNFKEQTEIIKEIKKDGSYIAVAWCQTSVVDDLWDYYDEESDESESYNINKGNKHWFLFDDLNQKGEK